MKGLAEAKAAIIRARNQDELYSVVGSICRGGLFSYADDMTLQENAAMARKCEQPRIADLIEFAAKYEDKL